MNCLLWNCRGAGKASFCRNVKYLYRHYLVDVVVVFETHISGDQAERVCRSLGIGENFRVEAQGFSGGIWLVWDSRKLAISVINNSDFFVHTRINKDGKELDFVFVYGPPTVGRRKEFWKKLEEELARITGPYYVGGDFNCITQDWERIGGSGLLHLDSQAFRNVIDGLGLVDMGYVGQPYTWSRGKDVDSLIAKRLDRILMNVDSCVLLDRSRATRARDRVVRQSR